ncbi:MAG: amylo-alpha-1,6-glucosidase [Gemmatimonadaceae bacterium]
MSARVSTATEWLEADGLGGFASGRADGIRTRRYHALLLTAQRPPTGRVVLVNGLDVSIETDEGTFALSSQRYTPDVVAPDGATRLVAFTSVPWPTWTYRLPSGLEVIAELVIPHGSPTVALGWRLARTACATLRVRPFLSGRDTHSTHHANDAFRFAATTNGERVSWQPYEGLPAVHALTNGAYRHAPEWYRNFQYDDERARGLDFTEDLASPGEFSFALDERRAVLLFSTDAVLVSAADADGCWTHIVASEEARRAAFMSPLHRAADTYVVRRGSGKTIVAGYPWFSDWGRDTFIALRGICLAGDRLEDARDILLEWTDHVSQGMLPNYFPEAGQSAEYNSVDASLWFVVAAHELLARARRGGWLPEAARRRLLDAVEAIVSGYAAGTRFGIRADDDGLLAAGQPGVQLTWMDAKVGDWVVTPRIGKPVEVQALWINALRIAGAENSTWARMAERAEQSFGSRFWNAARGCLFDVVDVNHARGANDGSLRPNQILAVGGLPHLLLRGERAVQVLDTVERHLLTPAGLRSLEPTEPFYAPTYGGDMRARDAAYHEGTVWGWLIGPFIDAWVGVRGGTPQAREEARARFLVPFLEHYDASETGQISEIADGAAPHTPRGCPFQAWSVGEALRVAEDVLRVDRAPAVPRRGKRARVG